MNKPAEKIVYVDFGKGKTFEYIPEDGYVIRDTKLYDNHAIVWLQYLDILQ